MLLLRALLAIVLVRLAIMALNRLLLIALGVTAQRALTLVFVLIHSALQLLWSRREEFVRFERTVGRRAFEMSFASVNLFHTIF